MQSWQITLFGYIGAAVLFVGLVNLQLSYMHPKAAVAPTEETQPVVPAPSPAEEDIQTQVSEESDSVATSEGSRGQPASLAASEPRTLDPFDKFPSKLVAIPMLVTSRASKGQKVEKQALVTAFLATWRSSVVPRPNIKYLLQIGYDKGDLLYDNPSILEQLGTLIEEATAGTGLSYTFERLQMPVANTISMWNELVRKAYQAGADYFYLLHDDTSLVSRDWAPQLIQAIETGTAYPGLGIIGSRDRDSGFEDCGPYPFISRLHLDIFGADRMHPPQVFRNHGGEVYLCALYRNFNSSFVVESVVTRNHQEILTQGERYSADASFVGPFKAVVQEGTRKVRDYIQTHKLQLRTGDGELPGMRE